MSSILEMLAGQLGSGGVRDIGSRIGSDEGTTGKAISAALPLLLGGLARNAKEGSGASALAGALDRDLDFRKPDPKFPGPPHAQFYVKSHCKDEDFDWPIISANFVTLPRPE